MRERQNIYAECERKFTTDKTEIATETVMREKKTATERDGDRKRDMTTEIERGRWKMTRKETERYIQRDRERQGGKERQKSGLIIKQAD